MLEFPITGTTRALTSHTALETALEQAKDAASLKALADQTAAIQDLMHRMQLALEEQNKLAEFRIRVERKLGLLLVQQVHRGGCGSKSHLVTSNRGGSSAPLPKGISRMQSVRFRQLARIPEEVVTAYIADARRRRTLITDAGLRRAGSPKPTRAANSSYGHHDQSIGPDNPLWSAVQRVMDARVCIGLPAEVGARFPDARHVGCLEEKVLSGGVLVLAEADPEVWLGRLATARSHGQLSEALLLFQPWSSQEWLAALGAHQWILCFLQQPPEHPWALAYLSERKHAFALVFREVGLVMRPFAV